MHKKMSRYYYYYYTRYCASVVCVVCTYIIGSVCYKNRLLKNQISVYVHCVHMYIYELITITYF